jgi:hypothetical protein
MRKQDTVIQSLATRESYLVCEADRLRTDNEKLYRWMRSTGFVIDEMTLNSMVAHRSPDDRDSYRRQLYLFNCLSLIVWNGMEGRKTRPGKRSATKPMRSVLSSEH